MRRRRPFSRVAVIVFFFCAIVANATVVIGTKRGKVYHNHPGDCASARRIQDGNVTRFASVAEARAAGRRQCRTCKRLDEKAAEAGDQPEKKPKKQRRKEPDVVDDPKRVEPKPAINGRPPERIVVAPESLPRLARATDVLDGGTIDLDTGDKARLLGIVVPRRGQPVARDAARFIKEQTRDRLLRISVFVTACAPTGRDALGRWWVSITPQPDGRDLAGELLFQGYAWLDRDRATSRQAEYARLEEAALNARRGIWRQLDGPAGERSVVTGRGATQYHGEKCVHTRHLTNAISLSVNEARARRLVPCEEYRAKGAEKSAKP